MSLTITPHVRTIANIVTARGARLSLLSCRLLDESTGHTLAVVMGLYARKTVGWAMSLSPDKLSNKAFAMAFEARGKSEGLMFHFDQGCQ